MQNDKNTTLERIIGKIDNDFNPDNSDWIPRVGAWVIDAMSILDCTPKRKVRKKCTIVNRIVNIGCNIGDNFKVYDICNRRVPEYNGDDGFCCECSTSTGELPITITDATETVACQAITINGYPPRYNVVDIAKKQDIKKNYVKISCNQIEVNFDDCWLYIEYEEIETVCSEYYGCELPVIPNNGLVIEAIVYFCMYKMLCRGYKHPVFNLQASQYGTNPYYMWISMKDEAKRSYLNKEFDNIDLDAIWRSAFYISAFDPKRN